MDRTKRRLKIIEMLLATHGGLLVGAALLEEATAIARWIDRSFDPASEPVSELVSLIENRADAGRP